VQGRDHVVYQFLLTAEHLFGVVPGGVLEATVSFFEAFDVLELAYLYL
jgi:hypothetical protein